jgi:hypothetical protein
VGLKHALKAENASTYTHVNGENEQKRLEEQNLERPPKNPLHSSPPMLALSFQCCMVSFIAGLSPLGGRLAGK